MAAAAVAAATAATLAVPGGTALASGTPSRGISQRPAAGYSCEVLRRTFGHNGVRIHARPRFSSATRGLGYYGQTFIICYSRTVNGWHWDYGKNHHTGVWGWVWDREFI
jgi:hypothetical protein